MALEVLVARTREELDACFSIRYEVFGKEYNACDDLGHRTHRIIDSFDTLPTTLNLLALYNGGPAGTVRLLKKNEEIAKINNWTLGIKMEEYFDLSPYKGMNVSEIPNTCVLGEYRGMNEPNIVIGLWSFAIKLSKLMGITHLCAIANPETDCLKEAEIIYNVLKSRGYVSEDIDIKARNPSYYCRNPKPYFRAVYNLELVEKTDPDSLESADLDYFEVPRFLKILYKCGLKFNGKPVYIPSFKGCAIPVCWAINELSEAVTKKLERSLTIKLS